MTDQLRFEVQDSIATITLNRPDKLNAFTTEMLLAWADAIRESARRDDVRVLVLTGAGKGFCSGGDVRNMGERAADSAYERKRALQERVHQIPLLMSTFDKPALVAVNGVAAGAGMDMALMGDIRIAARSARFAESYVRIGAFAGDGGTWYLPRIIGMARALELLWTGRFVDASEALSIGLVSHVVDDEQLLPFTYELASRIAQSAPLSVRMLKRAAYQGQSMDLRSHLELASSHMAVLYSTQDHREAVAAFQEKRAPHFKGE